MGQIEQEIQDEDDDEVVDDNGNEDDDVTGVEDEVDVGYVLDAGEYWMREPPRVGDPR